MTEITQQELERVAQKSANIAHQKTKRDFEKRLKIIPNKTTPFNHIKFIEKNLSRSERDFLVVLARSIPSGKSERVMSQRAIASRMKVSIKTVERVQKSLRQKGVIEIELRYSKNGKRAASLIKFSSYANTLSVQNQYKKQPTESREPVDNPVDNPVDKSCCDAARNRLHYPPFNRLHYPTKCRDFFNDYSAIPEPHENKPYQEGMDYRGWEEYSRLRATAQTGETSFLGREGLCPV